MYIKQDISVIFSLKKLFEEIFKRCKDIIDKEEVMKIFVKFHNFENSSWLNNEVKEVIFLSING